MNVGIALFAFLSSWSLAADFNPRDLPGFDSRLASKGSVLLFLSSRCPCSASHEPALKELHSKFSAQGIQFFGIHSNVDEPTEESEKYFKAAGLPFPILQDTESRWANQLGALKTPHAFLFNSEGKIVFQGGVDNSKVLAHATQHFLHNALTALSRGQPIPVPEARTLGCVIKR